jgi:predicted nucleic acid-binding Zn ribbon protein
MPIYSYSCQFHKEFEVQQSIKDDPLEECPLCIKEGRLEYHCKKCNNIWTICDDTYKEIKPIDSPNICRGCFSEDTISSVPKPKRLISLSSFILKGGGWSSEGYK